MKMKLTLLSLSLMAIGTTGFAQTDCDGYSPHVAHTAAVICPGTTATLTAGPADHYLWSTGDTTQSITVDTANYYSVTLMGNDGCTLESDVIGIATFPSFIIDNEDHNFSVCDGQGVSLGLSFAGDPGINPSVDEHDSVAFQWFRNGIAVDSAIGSEYDAKEGGSYTITITVGTCSATSAARTVTNKPSPVANFSYTGSTSLCQGQSLKLNADVHAGYTYRWVRDGDVVGSGPTYSAKVAGTYNLYASLGNGCTNFSSASASVTVNALPVAMLTSADNDSFCSGSTVMLNAAPTGGSYQYDFMRSSMVMGTSSSSDFTATLGGNYKVKVTDLNTGCVATSAPYRIYSITTPTANAKVIGGNLNLNNGPVELRANYSPTLSYQWTRNTVDVPGANMREFSPTQSGAYRVITTRAGMCSTTSNVISVVNIGPARLTIATTAGFELTGYPNPVNDQFNINISGLDVIDGRVQVIDMSGRVVLSATVKAAQSAIDMSSLVSGLYIVNFNDVSGNKATLKVTKN